jgi:heme/copper-type cytochrome/quinol oxidase subunit 2
MSLLLDLIGFIQDLFFAKREKNRALRIVLWIAVALGAIALAFYGWDYLVTGRFTP